MVYWVIGSTGNYVIIIIITRALLLVVGHN
jgi:hypothetical protein